MKSIIYLNDDAQCIELLTKADKLKLLAVPEGKYSAHCCFAFDGHWVFANHFANHDDPKEDGYTMGMIPQSEATREEAAKMFMEILNKCLGGPEHMSFVEY